MKNLGIFLIVVLFLSVTARGIYYFFLKSKAQLPLAQTGETLKKNVTQRDHLQSTGKLLDVTQQDSFSLQQITQSNNSFLSSTARIAPKYSVDRHVMKYESTDSTGEIIEIRAQLFIPSGTREPFPLYVVGQGTTGLGDQCAPSQEQPSVSNWGNYLADMLSYSSQGYIVVFPDYEGFNDPNRIHHYFNAENEAHVLLDATRAAFAHLKSKNIPYTESVFYGGYSQGGHAAFAVKDYAKSYAPEIPIKGVMGFGATTDMTALLKENPSLAPYLIHAYTDWYGDATVDASKIIQSQHLSTLAQDTTSICVGGIYQKYGYDASKIYTNEFRAALTNNRLEQEYPDFKKVLDENNSGLKDSTIPSLVIQGSTDPIVTVRSQKEFMRELCTTGTTLTYIEYPGIHHYQTRQVSIKDALDWMRNVEQGDVPPTDCGNL